MEARCEICEQGFAYDPDQEVFVGLNCVSGEIGDRSITVGTCPDCGAIVAIYNSDRYGEQVFTETSVEDEDFEGDFEEDDDEDESGIGVVEFDEEFLGDLTQRRMEATGPRFSHASEDELACFECSYTIVAGETFYCIDDEPHCTKCFNRYIEMQSRNN